jgi:hypothetical protein
MRRPMNWLALMTAAGVAACSDPGTDAATAPEFRPDRSGCSFPTIQQAVNAQFTGSTDTDVSALVNAAKGLATDDPAAADLLLYEVLDSLSAKFGQGTADNASTLAYQTLLCTSGGAAGLTATTFVAAFGSTGAFGSVGYETADSRTVASHDNSRWVLHPPTDETWASISSKAPLIIYGAPITIPPATFTADPPILSNIFDWKSHPSGVVFNPKVVVGNCEQGGTLSATYIQHNTVQSHPSSSGPAEILDFVTPDCSGSVAPDLRLGFGDRLWRFFAPATAYAAFFLPTSGGRKGALSPDAAVSVDALVFSFKSQPHKSANKVGVPLVAKDGNELTVFATSDGGTDFNQTQVFGWLESTNNQGSFVEMCHNWVYSDENGEFHFEDAVLNKAGGYTVTFKSPGTNESTSAPGTPQLDPIVQPITDLFNVKNGVASACPPGSSYPGTGPLPAPPTP